MLGNYISFIIISVMAALINYGIGLWLILFIGLLADPVRKLTIGTPFLISAAFAPIFIIVYLKCIYLRRNTQNIYSFFPYLRKPFHIFITILIVNSFRPILENFQYWPVVLYSLTQYVGIIIAIILGFYLIREEADLVKMAKVYLFTVTPFLLTVIPHLLGLQNRWPVLQTMEFGEKAYVHWHAGETLRLINGVFRNPEPMGWHAMMGTVVALFLFLRERKNVLWKAYSVCFMIFGTFCVLVSGRRKFFVGISAFLIIFLILTMKKQFTKMIKYLTIFIILIIIGWSVLGRYHAVIGGYIKAGETGIMTARLEANRRVIGSIFWAIKRDGFFGRGIGATAQGVRHLEADSIEMVTGSGIESGSGKIVSELGVPGIAALFFLLWAYIKSFYDILIKDKKLNVNNITIIFLLSVVLTNLIIFSMSHQIYADPLVGMLTGLSFGFLLAVPKMNEYDGR